MYPADSLESEPAELLVVAVGDGLDQRRQEPAEPLAVDDLVADRVRADPGEEGGGEEEALLELGPNSIEKFWLEVWLEKSLEFWLEITYAKKMF